MTDLAALLSFVASDLDEYGYRYAGVLRQAARRLCELERQASAAGRSESGCEWCGAPLEQPVTGQRKRFCPAHRRKRARTGTNPSVDSRR